MSIFAFILPLYHFVRLLLYHQQMNSWTLTTVWASPFSYNRNLTVQASLCNRYSGLTSTPAFRWNICSQITGWKWSFWLGNTHTQTPISDEALGWWECYKCQEEVGSISYLCLWALYIFIDVLAVHCGQEMWLDGLQWACTGSVEETLFHKSLQQAVIGLRIPARITTHSVFVLIKKCIKTFALAP